MIMGLVLGSVVVNQVKSMWSSIKSFGEYVLNTAVLTVAGLVGYKAYKVLTEKSDKQKAEDLEKALSEGNLIEVLSNRDGLEIKDAEKQKELILKAINKAFEAGDTAIIAAIIAVEDTNLVQKAVSGAMSTGTVVVKGAVDNAASMVPGGELLVKGAESTYKFLLAGKDTPAFSAEAATAGLQYLVNMKKPEDMSDADFAKVTKDCVRILTIAGGDSGKIIRDAIIMASGGSTNAPLVKALTEPNDSPLNILGRSDIGRPSFSDFQVAEAAVQSGDRRLVGYAISDGASTDSLVALAAQKPDTISIIKQLLIKGGADINKPDADGKTAIEYRAEDGDAKGVAALAKLGAKASAETVKEAFKNGHLDVVETLVVPETKFFGMVNAYDAVEMEDEVTTAEMQKAIKIKKSEKEKGQLQLDNAPALEKEGENETSQSDQEFVSEIKGLVALHDLQTTVQNAEAQRLGNELSAKINNKIEENNMKDWGFVNEFDDYSLEDQQGPVAEDNSITSWFAPNTMPTGVNNFGATDTTLGQVKPTGLSIFGGKGVLAGFGAGTNFNTPLSAPTQTTPMIEMTGDNYALALTFGDDFSTGKE